MNQRKNKIKVKRRINKKKNLYRCIREYTILHNGLHMDNVILIIHCQYIGNLSLGFSRNFEENASETWRNVYWWYAVCVYWYLHQTQKAFNNWEEIKRQYDSLYSCALTWWAIWRAVVSLIIWPIWGQHDIQIKTLNEGKNPSIKLKHAF